MLGASSDLLAQLCRYVIAGSTVNTYKAEELIMAGLGVLLMVIAYLYA